MKTKLLLCAALCGACANPARDLDRLEKKAGIFALYAQTRAETPTGNGGSEAKVETVLWDAKQTAVIICDMWDKHTCRNATRRVAEMAPRANEFVQAARRRGALIVHAPSDTMAFYEGTPGRALAKNAPRAEPREPIKARRLDPEKEGRLPIDDTDWCDDDPPCVIPKGKPWPWTREHPAIEIVPGDAVSESGQEMYNLFAERGIRNILICGVHTNMCVLGRSFGIRQMTRVGMNVMLVRDLTDCLYNPTHPPYVSHDRGTELMIEHIEKHWCPSVRSSDIMGRKRE